MSQHGASGSRLAMTQAPSPAAILIGAIRWDAWYDPQNGTVAQAVETDLAPQAFLSRAPAFTTVNPDGTLSIDGDSAAEMDSEIQLAHAAGINYWAFDFYGAPDPMSNALQLYLQGPINSLVDFALIDGAGWGATMQSFQAQIAQRVALMEQPSYQCVQGDRPLYYLMVPSSQILDQWWGGDPANMRQAVDALRAQVMAAVGADPYIVVMGPPLQAAAFAEMIGADAISAYAIAGTDQNASYQTLTNETMAGWNAELATGQTVVPTVMTGWDPSPRVQNPVPWGSSGDASYAQATPTQIAAPLQSAIAWCLAHPDSTAGTALVYAWNEFDEGGWLAPTYVAGDPAGDTSRLAALAAVTALYQGAVATQNADGSFTVALSDGSQDVFSSAGALVRTVAADGSAVVFNADNSISNFNASGALVACDHPDGTSVTYGADGTATFWSVSGVVTRIVNPDGSWKTPWPDGWLHYSASGQYLEHEVDLAGGGERLYNAAGHLTEVIGADGSQTLYGASGAITKIIAEDGSSKLAWSDGWLHFSASGQYLEHEVDLGNGAERLYNAAGRLFETISASGVYDLYASDGSQTLYAANGTVTKTIAEDGSAKLAWSDGWLWFDSSGKYLQHEVDLPTGGQQFYNAQARLTETVQPNFCVTLIGGTLQAQGGLVLIASSSFASTITDIGTGLTVEITPASSSVTLLGLAADPSWHLDMMTGFASVAALAAAFRPDGHGGSVLTLPGSVATIDLAGITTVSSAHLQIGAT